MMSTQDEILAILLEQDSQPISGQALADQLGLSRTAVWKAVEGLRQQGYQIASLSKRGYLLERVSHALMHLLNRCKSPFMTVSLQPMT